MGTPLAKIRFSTRLYLIILLGLLVSACVQPVEPTPTPGTDTSVQATATPAEISPSEPAPTRESGPTTDSAAPTPLPTTAAATFPTETIASWLLQQQYSPVVRDLVIFEERTEGPDSLIGFVFANQNDERCAGFIQATAATTQIWMGDIRCGGSPIIAGSALFRLTSGQNYVAAYGYIDATQVTNANAISVEFTDGSSANQMLSNNGFLALKPGLVFPTRGTVIQPDGNTLTNVLFQ